MNGQQQDERKFHKSQNGAPNGGNRGNGGDRGNGNGNGNGGGDERKPLENEGFDDGNSFVLLQRIDELLEPLSQNLGFGQLVPRVDLPFAPPVMMPTTQVSGVIRGRNWRSSSAYRASASGSTGDTVLMCACLGLSPARPEA